MILSTSVPKIWRAYGLNEAEIFASLAACGFKYLDIDLDTRAGGDWLAGDPAEWARDTRRKLSDAGMAAAVAHVGAGDPFAESESIKKAIRCAGALGIKNAVVPLGAKKDNDRAVYEKCNRAYLAGLLEAAEEADVTLLIEHCGSWHVPHFSHGGYELIHILELMGLPERLKINLNIAHLGIAEIQPLPEIRLLGDFIRSVDAADNFGGMPLGVEPEREKLGFAPMMGYIDYDRVMQGLRDVGYDGVFNLRMDMPRVFEKKSPYVEDAHLERMPRALTERLTVWSRHLCEHALSTYGFTGGGL